MKSWFVMSFTVGALTFSFLQLAADAAGLDTFQALPAALQRAAPAFSLPDLHGNVIRMADLRGNVVVVRFWVTW